MYLDFYGFREKPFNLTPDPRFVFLSKNHREAFAHLLYGIENRMGFIALTGEVGLGKTTVLRSLLSQLDPDHYRTALIFNPCLSPPELLQNINREFGIQSQTANSGDLLEALNAFLLEQNAEGRTVVLAIDEVQNLETSILEQIRLISNLETDKEKLIQIVLSGQPEFVQILKKKEIRQLSQRITVQYHLKPMDFDDTVRYIDHRLGVAGGRSGVIFSRAALKKIYAYSRGIPRLINVACDRSLLAGYTKDTAQIGYAIAAEAIRDMRRSRTSRVRRWRLMAIPALALLAAFLAAGIFYTQDGFLNRFGMSQQIAAKENQPLAPPVLTGGDVSRAMAAELGTVPEAESNRQAFNILAAAWSVSPVPDGVNLSGLNSIERAARDRGLQLYTFSAESMGTLRRFNRPAVLELILPDVPGRRFVVVTQMENDKVTVAPQISGKTFLSQSELEKHWSGHGYLLWKDHFNLLMRVSPDSKGPQVRELQRLLRDAGTYRRPLTGVYDGDTVTAVKNFQSTRGIERDGIVDAQTLILLYRSIDRYEAPGLTLAGRK